MSGPNPSIHPWIPYVAPYALFAIGGFVGSELLGREYLSLLLRTLLSAGALLHFWRKGAYPELSLRPGIFGITAGVVGYLLWVLPENLLSVVPRLPHLSSFNPDEAGPDWRTPLLAFRLLSGAMVVPVFEELLLRSFLVRYLEAMRTQHGDFRRIPIGQISRISFWGVVITMAVTHDRWLRGGAYSALMLGVLYKEKRMDGVIWAHAVTNLCLAIHVMVTENWSYW
jgi:CAAX prenyl protease-like protein